MQTSIFDNDDSMPAVVKDAVTGALPGFIAANDDRVFAPEAVRLAAAFGDRGDFQRLISEKSALRDDAEKKLVHSFQKNLELLVQKTWVEKADEAMKEDMLFRISGLCKNLSRYDYHKSLSEFLPVLHDVVYLLFGTLAKADSFLEYAVRIDPDFGFFWFYINSLPDHKDWPEEKCRAAVLLGIFFLANF
jgi:hypothetical protein